VIRQDGAIVGGHPRRFGRGEAICDPWHYVPLLARKPGALRNGAPFKDWLLPASLEPARRKLTELWRPYDLPRAACSEQLPDQQDGHWLMASVYLIHRSCQSLGPCDGALDGVAPRFLAVVLLGAALDQGADVIARAKL